MSQAANRADPLPPASSGPAPSEVVLYDAREPAFFSLGRWAMAVLTLGLAALVYGWHSLGSRVKLTSERLILKRGLLNSRTEYLELYRVTDLAVEEPLLERVLGYGRVVVVSSDRTESQLVLRGLRKPAEFADQMRRGVESQKKARRVATFAEA